MARRFVLLPLTECVVVLQCLCIANKFLQTCFNKILMCDGCVIGGKLCYSQPVPRMTIVSQSEMNIRIPLCNAQYLKEILKMSLKKTH